MLFNSTFSIINVRWFGVVLFVHSVYMRAFKRTEDAGRGCGNPGEAGKGRTLMMEGAGALIELYLREWG